jgi:MFS family permease
MVPFMLPVLLISNFFLLGKHTFYNITFTVQVVFYLSALAGYLLDRNGRKAKVFALPLYFCVVNTASVAAFFRTIKGKKSVTWETVRQ